MAIEIKVPDLGEGVASGDVLEVFVQVGDVITKDQGVVELETDKATVSVPASAGGKVVEVLVKAGQTVAVGQALIKVEGAATATAPAAPKAAPAASAPAPAPAPAPAAAAPAAVVPPAAPAPVAAPAPAPAPAPVPVAAAPAAAAPSAPKPTPAVTAAAAAPALPLGDVAAGPAIRRFAREVGVDLSRVVGTGQGGRVTREDVLNVVRQANRGGSVGAVPASAAAGTGEAAAPVASGDRDSWGPVRKEKMSRIRRTIADQMHRSWTTVPRVTNFDDADITDLEEFRQASKDDYASQGIKLTTMPFLIKAVAMALRANPALNASIDMEQGEVTYKEYVNIGIAVDTDRGLVVPSLREADRLSIPDVARRLASIAEAARTNNFTIDDMRGSTFTISNLGAIGGTYSTPIVNVPETAILLIGRSRKLPVVIGDEVQIRLMMPLSLSYDHRLVDGAMAARFLNTVIGYLKAPSRLLLAL